MMRRAGLIASLLASTACATNPPVVRQQCNNPDAQLAAVLQPYEELRAKGCPIDPGKPGIDCERLRIEIARLAVICPTHTPTLMANAVLAYDEKRPADAQQYIDLILAQPRSFPDAAALRGQIAIEEGNLPFALRLLEQQINLAPDQPGLHETYAAALYLGGQLATARAQLATAQALGAPRWRIAYHLGLIEEASGNRAQAVRDYTEAVSGNANFQPAAARLKALQATAAPQ